MKSFESTAETMGYQTHFLIFVRHLKHLVICTSHITINSAEEAEAIQAFNAAMVHQRNRRYIKSQKLLEHAFRLDPDNTDVLVALGEALEGSWRLKREVLVERTDKANSRSLIRLSESPIGSDDGLLLVADQMYTRALIVNPQLENAENRKSRLMPLVEEIDQRRSVSFLAFHVDTNLQMADRPYIGVALNLKAYFHIEY
ncbi:unnamed protein product [Echinostoma caproni]|uniref:TPR_REGION domain-containing protein n=1 Tax=Echinostoma caproni TaxID=27848 RepID=A0A183BEM3_9TREM|nr:unnamed protein product [Echinostoma caproni]